MATAVQVNNPRHFLPHLECVDRFNQLPVVETAVGAVGNFYHRLKRSHTVAEWTLGAAEAGVTRVALTLAPPLAVPLHLADSALCISLAFVEDTLPAVKLPPHELLESVRSLVCESAGALTRPVLRRASSVRELAAQRVSVARDYGLLHANNVLSTRVGSLAADGLEVGLGLAEQLIDTYLPDTDKIDGDADRDKEDGLNDYQGEDEVDGTDEQQRQQRQQRHQEYLQQRQQQKALEAEADNNNRALHTVHRVDRLTRTLQRRLTRRTLAQVKSLREHAMDAVSYVLGLAHMAVTDPRGSAARVAAVWSELSGEEPENQPPPETLEQRTALLAREAARRLVHAVNAISALPAAAAATFSHLLIEILHNLRLDGPVHAVMARTRLRYEQLEALLAQLNSLTGQILEAMSSPWKREPRVANNVANNHHHVVANNVNHAG